MRVVALLRCTRALCSLWCNGRPRWRRLLVLVLVLGSVWVDACARQLCSHSVHLPRIKGAHASGERERERERERESVCVCVCVKE